MRARRIATLEAIAHVVDTIREYLEWVRSTPCPPTGGHPAMPRLAKYGGTVRGSPDGRTARSWGQLIRQRSLTPLQVRLLNALPSSIDACPFLRMAVETSHSQSLSFQTKLRFAGLLSERRQRPLQAATKAGQSPNATSSEAPNLNNSRPPPPL